MPEEKLYDVIIAGAGPAGMMLASDLAPDFSVLVLEKGKAGTTTRSWYTFLDRIKANGLEKAVVAKPRHLVFYMGEDAQITYADNHALIDENKALEIFKKRAEKNGAVFQSGTEVKDARVFGSGISVITNRGIYSGKLLIDCMGTNSPLVLKNKLQKRIAIWTVYGARMTGLNGGKFFDPDKIGFYKIPDNLQPKEDKSNYMVGIYPKSANRGDAYIFHFDDTHREPEYLKPLFENVCKKWFPKNKKTGELRGWIYEGTLFRYALPRIIFIGDSGALAPPAIGMGFNENLRKHKLIASRIAEALQKNTLDARSLSNVLFDERASALRAFQRIIQRYFMYANTVAYYREGIKIFSAAGEEVIRAWMRNELTPALIAKGLAAIIKTGGLKKLFGAIPAREYPGLIKDLLAVMEHAALNKIHQKIHPPEKIRKCLLCIFGLVK